VPFKSQDLTGAALDVNTGLLMLFEDKRVGRVLGALDAGLK
jgi:hypothetical protein